MCIPCLRWAKTAFFQHIKRRHCIGVIVYLFPGLSQWSHCHLHSFLDYHTLFQASNDKNLLDWALFNPFSAILMTSHEDIALVILSYVFFGRWCYALSKYTYFSAVKMRSKVCNRSPNLASPSNNQGQPCAKVDETLNILPLFSISLPISAPDGPCPPSPQPNVDFFSTEMMQMQWNSLTTL